MNNNIAFDKASFEELLNTFDASVKTNNSTYIPTCGDFNESLKVEKRGQPAADDFYKNCLGVTEVKRYDYNNPEHRVFQNLDIDCTIKMEPKSLDIFWLNVSEKFRQSETGDMCIELWSDFENQKPGWALKSTHTNKGPDLYLYSTPKYFFEIFKNKYFDSMINKIVSEWDWKTVYEFINKEEKRLARHSNYNGCYNIKIEDHDAKLLKVWSKRDGKRWFGVCICIPWTTLFNEYLLNINMYDKNYNRLNINREYA